MLLWISIVLAGVLAFTVPWFFIGRGSGELGGWPAWVVYTLAMNLVFAVATALLLRRCWHRLERTDSEQDQEGP